MAEQRDSFIRERVQQAVRQRCRDLQPDPFLASRVMRLAEEKGEIKVKKKLSLALVMCILLALLTVTALAAAALLSGQEIIETRAIPAAKNNDGEVRINDTYTYEELVEIVELAAENGISLEGSGRIMEALARHEGYYEEETIMAICREAFGGLYSDWTIEERYWFKEKMVEIGFISQNDLTLPGEGHIPAEEARLLAVTLIEAEYGELPLEDPTLYRVTEDFDDDGWYFNYHPLTLEGKRYQVQFMHDRSYEEVMCRDVLAASYTETQLRNAIDVTYGYRTQTQINWGVEGWYAFGQMLPEAERTDNWSAEYDGYLATTYLLPQEGDLTADEAKAIAKADAGIDIIISSDKVLLGRGEERIWKMTLRFLGEDDEIATRVWEINAQTGEILHRLDFGLGTQNWARYMLYETYTEVNGEALTPETIQAAAIAALYEEFGVDTIPFGDPTAFTVKINTVGGGERYLIIFTPLTVEYARCAVSVRKDGTAIVQYGDAAPLTADNLNDRMDDVYGSRLRWEQSTWVEFDRLLDTLGEPTTFEGKLFAQTHYPDASSVPVTLDDALDTVQLDLGDVKVDPTSWVLIDAEPNPVWKIRTTGALADTLYEVDAVTGEIVDRELYVIQRSDFDHNMKMFTLRRDYMPAALNEFGPVRVAMELTVKSDLDLFAYCETVFMNSDCYEITVDGMTVTFKSVDGTMPSYRTTILDNGMDAEIEVTDSQKSIGHG